MWFNDSMSSSKFELRLVSSNENIELDVRQRAVPLDLDQHLLSNADLVEVARYGVPWGIRPDLVAASDTGLQFTPKGLQYYTLSLHEHGIGQVLAPVRDRAGLEALHATIFSAVRSKVRGELHAEYQAGRIPAEERELVEARLFGGLPNIIHLLRRTIGLGGTDSNVIPVSFNKKRRS